MITLKNSECDIYIDKSLRIPGIKLNSVLENVYDKQKLQTRKAVVKLSLWRRDGGQLYEDQNEQQQQQSATGFIWT